MARATRGGRPYDVHPGLSYVQAGIASLEKRTGRTLGEWVRLVVEEGPPGEKERRAWLKAEHGLGGNSAWWIAERAAGRGEEDTDPGAYLKAAAGWVEAMFAGPKEGLRPLFEQLVKLGRSLGTDVKVCPCKTIVPLYRNHVFAEIKPTTRTRIDLGLALGGTKAPARLLETGGHAKGNRITHRIPVTSAGDIDEDVRRWLRTAYERDG
jgi:hypothetical protein